MADTTRTSTTTTSTGTAAGGAEVLGSTAGGAAGVTRTGSGKTVVADGVVAKIVGIAARDVPGVHALGGGAARALGALRGVVGGADLAQGVSVEVGETQVAADVTIVVDYPVPVRDVAEQVREAVATAVTQLVGMEVAEVNVAVADVHIPGEDRDDDAEGRVR